jgi:hypothetical protein
MLPESAARDIEDSGFTDFEALGQFLVGFLGQADFSHGIIGQLGVSVSFAWSGNDGATLLPRIAHVRPLGAEEQVPGICTGRVIASVQDKQTARITAVIEPVSGAVRRRFLAIRGMRRRNFSIVVLWISGSHPMPAGIWTARLV